MSHAIQHLVMPNLAFGAPEEMYVRLDNDKVHALMSEGRLLFDAGGRASFDTFFNSVTVGAWKTHTAVGDLQLQLRGTGRFIVRLGMHRIGHAQRWLAEHVVTLTHGADVQIEVDSWTKLESGMLYFAMEALEAGSLTSGKFVTQSAPQHDVKLGIVITHFNRKQWVLPAIARIRNELLNDPLYKDRVELIVVDNSQNITSEEAHGITLIPNKNLGGSGGFTRGLLHLKDSKDFTHCLFMDDDASCEIESLRRTYRLLEFSINPESSVAGGLLRELEPWRLIDKGSNFDGRPTCDKAGLDMRLTYDLLLAERESREADFGGWWFLAFNIESLRHYSFPFFVKCDDILFGLMNKFPILTLNGIACLSDDFSLKEGPLQRYLDTRGRLVLNILSERLNIFSNIKWLSKFILAPLLSYNYESAQAAILGASHVLKGPEFWSENLDTTKIRSEINEFVKNEKMVNIKLSNFDVTYKSQNESNTHKLFRWFTINGFILPNFLINDAVVYQNKGFRASLREIYRIKRVIYYYEATGTGYIAFYDRLKFFKLLMQYFRLVFNFIMNYKNIKKQYKDKLEYLTSEEYWRRVYPG